MKGKTRLEFLILAAVPFIMVLGNSMLIPVLPEMKHQLKLTPFQVGLIITAFSLPAGLVIPWAGFLSDRIGRKRVMAPALVIYGAGGLVAGLSVLLFRDAYLPVLIGRIIQGIGAGGTYQLAMALTGDIFQSRERTVALGLLESANGLGKVVSPIAGAAAALLAWYVPFFVYGTLAIPVALLLWFLVQEPPRRVQGPSISKYFGLLGGIFENKGVSLGSAFFAGFTVLFLLFGVLSYYTDLLEDTYGIKGLWKGVIIAGPILVMAITSYLTGAFFQKKPAPALKGAVWGGLFLMMVGLALAPLLKNIYLTYLCLVVLGGGAGLVLPALNTLITGAVAREERGLVTALYGTVRFFGAALGPPAFGLALALGPERMLFGGAALAVLAAGQVLILLNAQRLVTPRSGAERSRHGEPTEGKTEPRSEAGVTTLTGRGSTTETSGAMVKNGEATRNSVEAAVASKETKVPRLPLELLPAEELSQELSQLSQAVAVRARQRLQELQQERTAGEASPVQKPLEVPEGHVPPEGK